MINLILAVLWSAYGSLSLFLGGTEMDFWGPMIIASVLMAGRD